MDKKMKQLSFLILFVSTLSFSQGIPALLIEGKPGTPAQGLMWVIPQEQNDPQPKNEISAGAYAHYQGRFGRTPEKSHGLNSGVQFQWLRWDEKGHYFSLESALGGSTDQKMLGNLGWKYSFNQKDKKLSWVVPIIGSARFSAEPNTTQVDLSMFGMTMGSKRWIGGLVFSFIPFQKPTGKLKDGAVADPVVSYGGDILLFGRYEPKDFLFIKGEIRYSGSQSMRMAFKAEKNGDHVTQDQVGFGNNQYHRFEQKFDLGFKINKIPVGKLFFSFHMETEEIISDILYFNATGLKKPVEDRDEKFFHLQTGLTFGWMY
ncbi:MAG: hypothetical protein CL678_03490 [Bdellovibrionaceae bacterium]|nr:hypothetical protein [Pseudobdellovibrionaceae bacterium]|tara:strand:+ start:2340 stop:3290 length:951 start_codon:yes stop_codon:yes gene_type:complete